MFYTLLSITTFKLEMKSKVMAYIIVKYYGTIQVFFFFERWNHTG